MNDIQYKIVNDLEIKDVVDYVSGGSVYSDEFNLICPYWKHPSALEITSLGDIWIFYANQINDHEENGGSARRVSVEDARAILKKSNKLNHFK